VVRDKFDASILPIAVLVAAPLLAGFHCSSEAPPDRPTAQAPASSVSAAPLAAASTPVVSPSPRATRVVLITVDTLRADQPWTNYKRFRTPHLSALADSSLLFERTWSLANTTGPSLGGMLCSRYPSELQRDDCPLAGMDIEHGLAEVLESAGVWTASAHGHPYFGSPAAPRRGFALWRTVFGVLARRAVDGAVTGSEVADLALDLLKNAPEDRPSFLWIHFVDPHDKYVLHPGFPPSDNPSRGYYDGEVAYTDHQVGRVLQAIDASPQAASTAVVLTSDHGEGFGEHSRWRHGMTLHEEEVRVPLMVRAPGLAPARISVARSTLDVAPTIAALLGVTPAPSWRGRSLLDDTPASRNERPIIVDAPALMNAPARRAAVIGQVKVIEADGALKAFDLESDPGERSPLAPDKARDAIERAQELFSSIASTPSRRCTSQAFRTPH